MTSAASEFPETLKAAAAILCHGCNRYFPPSDVAKANDHGCPSGKGWEALPHGSRLLHCRHPDLEGIPVVIDVLTGTAQRLKTCFRVEDMTSRERCCVCKDVRTRRWTLKPRPGHDGMEMTIVEVTEPEAICAGAPKA